MAIKKSQLYSSLWSSCDALRGGMDASQYKDYILTLLFVKYVSDRAKSKSGSLIEVPEGASFDDLVKLKGDKEIGDKTNKVIGALAKANELVGVIDQADFNDEAKLGQGQEMQDRLSKLVGIFQSLDFGANRADGDDLLGDAYEYLMRHFATQSGKSKGQFYTPSEVSQVLAKVVGIGPKTTPSHTVYDPTCGSGSLLLKAVDEAPNGITPYGQEKDLSTWALARMNTVLHNHPEAELWQANTLAAPYFKDDKTGGLKTFDFAVANPPFSDKEWTTGFNPEKDEFGRFEGLGVPPAKNGDYAYLLHVVKSLNGKGKAAVILPHGVLFRGNKEADIRRNLIKRGLIAGVIGLPANLFYGTGIPACVVVIDKERAEHRSGVFLIDASKGFVKDGNKNRLRARDLHKIVDVFNHRIEIDGYSRMVPIAEIASPANDCNLNIPRYIDSSEPEDRHDLDAHLRGGIPERDVAALAAYWEVFPSLRAVLFEPGDRPGYVRARVATRDVKPTVIAHPEYQAFADRVSSVFHGWWTAQGPTLNGVGKGTKPREIVRIVSEDLLRRFDGLPLLEKYDAYQRLMEYWDETMQDDVDLVATDGWLDAVKPRPALIDKERDIKEEPDLTVGGKKWKMDLLQPALIVARYFAAEQSEVDALEVAKEAAAREIEEYVEEHAGEDDPLEDAKNEKGTVTLAGVKAQLKALKDTADADEEWAALKRCQELFEAEAAAGKALRDARAKLDRKTLAQYGKLTEAEVKALVIGEKWQVALRTALDGEVERIVQALAGRVRELEERYAEPLPSIEAEVEELSAKVEAHLRAMGLAWV